MSHAAWQHRMTAYRAAHGELATELERRLAGTLPADWERAVPTFTAETGNVATRAASGAVLNALAPAVPELLGGSADLTGSNNTNWKSVGIVSAANYGGRYVHYGIREHAMGAVMNGLALHGGIVPFAGTFLVFADYCRPAIRLAALMGVKVVYVFTHDSIGLGEDGPTHQPVEHLATLRAIPNCLVLRPGDANEVAEAWRATLAHTGGPVCLILTRQKVAFIDRTMHGAASGVARGAYVLRDVPAPKVVLIGTGSEVELAVKAAAQLDAAGIPARVVSMPSMERFAAQSAEYRASVLPAGVPRVAVEAAHPQSWYRWVGDTGAIVGIERFGASAPFATLYREFGITVERVVAEARRVVEG
jgi:transketolase